MRRSPHTLLWLPVIALALTSCSTTPRKMSGTESPYLLQLRQEYLAANPEGEFNAYVEKGEVVKGMDLIAVLASWGHPNVRTKDSPMTERWVYRDVDDVSKDWVEYTFTFQGSVLTEWDLVRHFAAGGRVDVPVGSERTSLSKGEYTASATTGSGAPKKQ